MRIGFQGEYANFFQCVERSHVIWRKNINEEKKTKLSKEHFERKLYSKQFFFYFLLEPKNQ